MATTIEWQKMPPRRGGEENGEERLFPRMKDSEVVNLDTICEKLATRSAYNRAELRSAFEQVVDGIKEQLAKGNTVDIEELGTFRLALSTEGVVTAATSQRTRKIRVDGIIFHPSSQMMKGIGKPSFRSLPLSQTSPTLSAQDLVAPLTEYLQTHDCITRQTVEKLFGLHRSTAASRLQELTHQGFLRAEGENRQRIYKLAD